MTIVNIIKKHMIIKTIIVGVSLLYCAVQSYNIVSLPVLSIFTIWVYLYPDNNSSIGLPF